MSETQNDCQPSTSGSGGSGGPSKNVEKNVTSVEECNKSEEGEETGAVTMLDVLQVTQFFLDRHPLNGRISPIWKFHLVTVTSQMPV